MPGWLNGPSWRGPSRTSASTPTRPRRRSCEALMDIRLPQLGEGADSGTVVKVFVKEGDHVVKDQILLELENEKAVAPIPSSASGVVASVHIKPGDKVTVGQVVVTLAAEGEEVAAPLP